MLENRSDAGMRQTYYAVNKNCNVFKILDRHIFVDKNVVEQ